VLPGRRRDADWARRSATSTQVTPKTPRSVPIHLQEVFATLYHNLGIDVANTTITDHNGRPQYLVDRQQVIEELV
jgi:hypothetical protein